MKAVVIVLIILATCSAIKLRNHMPFYQIQSSELADNVVSSIQSVKVETDRISFKGCNLNYGTLKYFVDGTISIGYFRKTSKFCPNRYDSEFADSLMKAYKMKNQGGKLRFYNRSGRQILVLNETNEP